MKDFVLDSTYKDATIVNSNDDIVITSSNKLSYNPTNHHTINLNEANSNYCCNNKSNKFNIYNIIDYL
ncbi:hypothetical protein CLPUN_05980 [Clostridium puniceum]|uniref:Uncharacterized protein n=1 Tax=Clostridium puniceum TaxID=29367 RepID=A0A1S8TWZ8_9CLOT|nr:hypothetical protein [Clostridium puniceum]OOM82102.1 hypothetical protein CLPUN_05980 [Clostridium puniceum]